MNPPNIAALRTDYKLATLDVGDVKQDPLAQLADWLNQAIEATIPEPTAMTLATVGHNQRPSSRVVLLKGLDAGGLVWFTNYQSRKGHELAANPFAALQFHWVELERVVRVEGRVEKIDGAESDAYFATRPLASRLGACASPQSETLANRDALVAQFAALEAAHGDNPPRPAHWGGYRLLPDRFEFWQGRRSRLHDRICYQLDAGAKWSLSRLAP